MGHHLSFWERLKAYRLKNNMVIVLFLVAIVIISLVVYVEPVGQENHIVGEIAIAVFTSLLATILAMIAEIYVQFKSRENDQFLEDIHTFGISNLNKNKEVLLREMLQDCDSQIWISGYRLIMTEHLKGDIAASIKRGASVWTLITPPWEEGFKLVYGVNEKVMDNYFAVFHAISNAKKDSKKSFEVRFTQKPLFSDTYRVDQHLVTGPYMHNEDPEYHRIMAKDFFSYNLIKKSRLYDLIENEYLTLWRESVEILNWERFDEAYDRYLKSDLREEEKIALLHSCCDPRPAGRKIEKADEEEQ